MSEHRIGEFDSLMHLKQIAGSFEPGQGLVKSCWFESYATASAHVETLLRHSRTKRSGEYYYQYVGPTGLFHRGII